MEGVGEAKPPRDFDFLMAVAGKAGNSHQKRMYRACSAPNTSKY
jgi:hypothetical protein